jgi:hypothetical protein
MDDNRKRHLAWAEFDAFAQNLPTSIQEKHVVEYHGILDRIHEATGEDISPFRIPDEELKREITSIQRRGLSGRPGSVSYSKVRYCDHDLIVRKIDALRNYFKRIEPPPTPPKKTIWGH